MIVTSFFLCSVLFVRVIRCVCVCKSSVSINSLSFFWNMAFEKFQRFR